MAVNKQTMQRIVIGIIALTMTVGTLGAYFLIILQTKDSSQTQQPQQQYTQYPVDPTAYKVSGAVSKLESTDLTVGAGDEAKVGDTVRVHYKGTFAQGGQKFDSSYDRGEPATLKIAQGQVIDGWVQGIPGMKVGGKRRLVIPSSLGYGATGNPPSIPPSTDLVFEVELLAVNPK